MRKYNLQINGKDVSVEVKNFSGDEAELELNGEVFQVQVQNIAHTAVPVEVDSSQSSGRSFSSTSPVSTPKRPAAATSKGSVPAPIPGVILSIYVAVGDTVRSGQPLLKMEAMKMENEVSATQSGSVNAILTQVGDSVLQGQELIQISPEED
jgi:biotin carboxyl carrier protein